MSESVRRLKEDNLARKIRDGGGERERERVRETKGENEQIARDKREWQLSKDIHSNYRRIQSNNKKERQTQRVPTETIKESERRGRVGKRKSLNK
jgi:hypothetical protein